MSLGMSMSMGMYPVLRQEQRLEQRQKLEQKLEQRLEQRQVQKLELKQYLELEDFIKGLIRWVTENNTWTEFNKNGFNFTYARVPYEKASPIADIAGPGFCHCQYDPWEELFLGKKIALAKGQWTIFLVEDMVPKELSDFVVLHERGEELSLGDHYFASKLEFAYVGKQKRVRLYSKFIDDNYPCKFVDLTEKVDFPILPLELIEFLSSQGAKNESELSRAEELIKKYPLPLTVLRKMSDYDDATKKVCETIKKLLASVQRETFLEHSPEKCATILNENFRNYLSGIGLEEARVVSKRRVNDAWNLFYKEISGPLYRETGHHINFPASFEEAYKAVSENSDSTNVV